MKGPLGVSTSEIGRYRDHLRATLKLPIRHGTTYRDDLTNAPREERARVESVANQLLSDWEAAGSPHLAGQIPSLHQLIQNLRRMEAERETARSALAVALSRAAA